MLIEWPDFEEDRHSRRGQKMLAPSLMNEKKSLGGGVESSHAQKIQSPGLDLMNEVYKDLLQVKSLEGSVEEDFRDLIKVLVEGAGSLEAHGAAASRLRREVWEIEGDLRHLLANITEAQRHLARARLQAEAREVELGALQLELVAGIRAGRVRLDYETGKLEGKVAYRPGVLGNPELLARLFARLGEERDPAVLHLDAHLLADV
eukprot:CAMPEP_0194668838 /NCGR_PEP_ID=MMETSP0295-20121207/4223_1 /TAXON_ID=39354 /ORGANISM="Heterosigma akashiwo, Strain CCMP2393" /LENGTH=204 /DNA_ID=CAMNT_0039551703 /DNA_START=174 /DNA_END=786 /DNA_ORIENTATION=-